MFRIQKILLYEFKELYEPIFVENPFTQVDENGIGLKQLHLGLTTTNIIVGRDDFSSSSMQNINYQELDPEIETFALVSILPIRILKIQFFCKNERKIMKVIICDDNHRKLYFEFGGHIYRNFYWNVWRERISYLCMTKPLFNRNSPFSSSDAIAEEQICKALIHSTPHSINTMASSNCFQCDGDSGWSTIEIIH